MLQLYWGFLGGLIWNSSRLFGNRLLCKKTSSQWKKNCGARVFGVEDESWYHGISSKMFVGPNGIPQETGILGWSSLPRCQPSLPMTRKITYLASTAKNMIALETCRFEYFMSFPLRWQGFRGNDQFQQMKIRQWHSAECWHTRHMQSLLCTSGMGQTESWERKPLVISSNSLFWRGSNNANESMGDFEGSISPFFCGPCFGGGVL